MATSLEPGDIGFTSFNADGNKRFSFVLLRDISGTTSIYFTDNGWSSSSNDWYNTSEGTIRWTYTGGLPCGTRIIIDPTADSASLGGYNMVDPGFDISPSGDAILAYTGDSVNSVITFIAGINQDASGWTSSPSNTGDTDLPDELSDGSSAIAFSTHEDNWVYDCEVTLAPAGALRLALFDEDNWNSNGLIETAAPSCLVTCSPIPVLLSGGDAGLAYRFDGVNDHVVLPGWFNPDHTNFTVECWFKVESASGTHPLVQQLSDGGPGRTVLYVQGTQLRTNLGGTVNVSTDDIKTLDWNHAAVSWDGAALRLYLNGILQVTDSVTMESTNGNFRLARSAPPGNDFLEGQLDELRIWSDDLSEQRIREWMCKSLTHDHDDIASLIAYYRFDDANTPTLQDLVGTAHGTITGSNANQMSRLSGAAIGVSSTYTYSGLNIQISHSSGDGIELLNYNGPLSGIHLYLIDGAPNADYFGGAESYEGNYQFGVFKIGDDTTSYDVKYTYSNSSTLTGAANESMVGLARRHDGSDTAWQSQWFEGYTNTTTNTVTLPGQTGTMYAGIVAANNSLHFDGTDDYVSTSANVNVAGAFTAEAWIKISDTTTTRTIMSTRSGASVDGWVLSALANEQIEFRIGTSSGWLTTVSGSALDTAWHHVATVYDGDSSIYLYVDGSLVDSRTDVLGYQYVSSNPMTIGRLASASNYFYGRIDEIRIWNYELCATEINNNRNCQFDTTQVGLHAYYSFNQGVANSSNTGLDSLIEQSGTFFNGTLNNFSLSGFLSNWTTGSYGITGNCTPGSYSEIIILGEGDTIFHLDTVPSLLDSTNFGSIPAYTPFEVTYDIFNTGADTLFLTGVSFSGPNASELNAVYPTYILAGGSGTLRIQMNISTPGPIQADVIIENSDCNLSPYLFRVQGIALDRAGALYFDGVNDYVQIPALAINNIQSDWTLEGWFKPDSIASGYYPLIAKGEFPNPPSIWFDDDKIEVWMGATTATITSTHTLTAGTWVHVAATYTDSTVNLYVNGALDATATYSGAVPTSGTPYYLGYGEATYYFMGEMDEVRIWGRARSLTEVSATMNCELDGDECDLIHYYNFNAPGATATGPNTGITTLGDSANNGGNGTLTNFALTDTVSNWSAQHTSVSGNCSSAADAIPPIVRPFSIITVSLTANSVTLLPTSVDSASCDYYSGINTMSVNPSAITCGLDGTTAFLIVEDSAGNVDSAAFILNVVDAAPPTLAPFAVSTVNLDATGSGSILATAVDSATSDNCQLASVALSQSSFNCTNLGANTVWFYGTDTNGLTDSVQVQIDVFDVTLPTVNANNFTAYLDNTGSVTVDTTQVNGATYDECGIANMWLSQSNFTCADTALPNSVWFYAQDNGGNVDSVSIAITVLDTTRPVVNATNFTAYLDASGTAIIDTTDINVNSWDNCAIANMTLSQSNFTCADTAAVQSVTLTVTDVSGNSNSAIVQVTVVDAMPPTITASDPVVYLDAFGAASIDTSNLSGTYGDNCALNNVWLSQTTFDCSDVVTGSANLWRAGTHLPAIYSLGPASSAFGAGDNHTNFTRYLEFTSTLAFTLDSVTIYPEDRGFVEIVLQDGAGNPLQSSTVYVDPATVNEATRVAVNFYVAPGNYRLALGTGTTINGLYRNDAGVSYPYSVAGIASITGSSAGGGFYYFFYDWQITHHPIPQTQVWLYASDLAGNVDSIPVVVSVLDTVAPTVNGNNITVNLDPTGSVTIDTTMVNGSSGDLCGIDTMWLSQYTFTCGDTIAPVSIWLYAQDRAGNYDSTAVTVTVTDVFPPFLILTDTTVSIGSAGSVTIDTTFINNGSWDNCQIDTMWLSQYVFTCADTGAVQVVTFYARDVSGNVSSATANVTVIDGTPPTFITNDTTIILDATGNFTITTSYVYQGSVDNCTFDTAYLSRYDFNCADLAAPQLVTVYAQDLAGNLDSQVVTVTVIDNIFPVVNAQNVDLFLDATGNVTLDTTQINAGSGDICQIDSMWVSQSAFTCADTGINITVWFYARDFGGNVDSASAIVTVSDTTPPFLSTTDVTIYLDGTGSFTIDTTFINVSSWDNCMIDTMYLSNYTFSCADTVAPQAVTFTARDVSGNVASEVRNVTVVDTVSPVIAATDTTIWLDISGNWTIDTSYIHVSSFDNCAIDTIWLSRYAFNCADLSAVQSVTMFVRDISSNVSQVTVNVTVLDTFRPTVNVTNTTIWLDQTGSFTIDTTYINNGSWDNCYIDTMWLSRYTFSCADTVAPQSVRFYASDSTGNVDSADVLVTVIDSLPPNLITTDTTIYLDATGNFTIDTTFINLNSWDNCEIDTMWLSNYSYSCADTAAVQTVTFFARDISGNQASITHNVTVLDTTPPIVTAMDTTIWLDSSGVWTIDTSYVHVSSSDNCDINNVWLSRTLYDCSDLSAVQIETLYVSDISNNITAVPVNITVLDTIRPVINVTGTTVWLDQTGSFTIDTTFINVNSWDNCYIDTMWLSRYTFSCADTAAPQSVRFYAADSTGNTDSADVLVTVIDSLVPNFVTTDTTIYLDSTGNFTIDTTFINLNSWDNCEIDTMWLSRYDFSCVDTAAGQAVTFYARDISGNVDSILHTVTVVDTILPHLITTDTTIWLDQTGSWTIDTTYLNVASWDNCEIDTMWLSRYTFSCADTAAPQTVTFFARDISGNVNSVNRLVTVFDTLIPNLVTTDTTIWLDQTGSFTIDTTFINLNSWDNCEIDTMWLSRYTFSCVDTAAPQLVTFWARDISGNVDSVDHFVTVIDSLVPNFVTTDTTIYLDSTGNFTIDTTFINLGSWDNCEIDTMWLSRYDFSCTDTSAGQSVTFYARDISGNVDSILHTVTVVDTIRPVLLTTDTTIWLDQTGSYTIDTTYINVSSWDNCQIDTMWLSRYTFSCADTVAPQAVTFWARDISGNVDSVVRLVTVIDSLVPNLITTDTTVWLDQTGSFTIDTTYINVSSWDNCEIDTMWLSQYVFNCADTSAPQPVTFWAQDISGNVDSVVRFVTVLDTLIPNLLTTDTTIYLDSSGNFTIDTTFINAGSWDNCEIDTMWLSRYDFSCVDTAAGQSVTFYARDVSGNLDSVVHTVTVFDTIRPVLVTTDTTIWLDQTGSYTIDTTYINVSSWDNCQIDSMWLSRYTFSCADTVAPQLVTFWARDISGNVDSVDHFVTVIDSLVPNLVTQDTTIYLDITGNFTIDTTFINVASWDNCEIDTMWLSRYDFTCGDSNMPQPVTFYAQDISGNVDSVIRFVTVVDTLYPTVITTDTTIWLDATGNFTIDTTFINAGSWDNCEIDTMWLSRYDFNCGDTAAPQSVTFYALDVSGNLDSATRFVTVIDSLVPVLVTTDTTIWLDQTGGFTIDTTYLNTASYDNCEIDTMWLSRYDFSCSDTVAPQAVTFYAQDISGNVDSVVRLVTVIDSLVPNMFAVDTTIWLDATGNFTIDTTYLNNGSWDNCQIDTMWLSRYDFNCSDTVAAQAVTLYAQDISGNVDSITQLVTVIDTVVPIVFGQNITIALDSFGTQFILGSDLDSASFDNCAIDTFISSIDTFNCADIGAPVSVTFTVVDVSGNSSSSTQFVTVIDTIAPRVITQDINVYIDANGGDTITSADIDFGSWDSCGIASYVLDDSIFNCQDIGTQVLTLTVTDIHGNVSSNTATVTILDTIFPTVLVMTDTIFVDSFGNGIITPDSIDAGSFDNCSGFTRAVSVTNVGCAEMGMTIPVDLIVTDSSGNTTTVTTTVVVWDTIPPVPYAFDITVNIDSFGYTEIFPTMLIDSLLDSCDIDTVYLSVDTVFCTDVGDTVQVVSYAIDSIGNIGTDTSYIYVFDVFAPVVHLNDTVIYLADATSGNGTITIDSASLDSASWDNCTIASIVHDTAFDCGDLGANVITVTVTDIFGNVTVDSAIVTVVDTVKPHAFAQTITRYLDATGTATFTVNDIDSGSYDNCSVVSRTYNPTSVSCIDVNDTVQITFTATDQSGNVDTAFGYVIVYDTIRPTIFASDTTLYLDSSGNASVSASQLDAGTFDNCTVDSIYLSDSLFDCSELGVNQVLFVAVDIFGNRDTDTVSITVIDTVAPVIITQNDTVWLDSFGFAYTSVDSILVSTSNACGVDTVYLSDSIFTCVDTGINNITITSVDVNGNSNTVGVTVLVIDSIRPTILVSNDTLYLDATGQAVLDTSLFDDGTNDICGISSYVLSETNFDCDSAGLTLTIGLTVTDVNGNVRTGNVDITVLDTVRPVMAVQNITAQLDSFGNVTINSGLIDNGTADACGIASLSLNDSIFGCADVGANTVTLTAVDVNGNVDSATATVTVEDNIAPDVVTTNDTIALTAAGTAVITLDSIRISSTDACGVVTEVLSDTLFDCTDVGLNNITLTVTDVNGNASVWNATVYVIDTIAPTILVANDSLYLDASGQATLDTSIFDLGSFDNCGIASYVLSETNFDCDSAGLTLTIGLTVTDVNGNVSTSNVDITVLDTVTPLMSVQNITVQLDSFGDVTINSGMIDNGTSDACGIVSLSLNDSIFDCSNVGVNTVTLTAVDVNGNIDSATATVTVQDTIAPVVVVTNDTIALTASGTAVITLDSIRISSTDACGVSTEVLSDTLFDCTNVGLNSITLTVTDVNGNTTTMNATVYVIDTIAPTILVTDDTLYLNPGGVGFLDTSIFEAGSFDNCSITSYTLSQTMFDCDSAGQTVAIGLTLTDPSGNVSTGTVNITILDSAGPTVAVQNITVQLDSFGNATINSSMVDNGSNDNCGIASISLSDSVFNCSDVGANNVTMTVVDVSFNVDSAVAVVTVEDNIAPDVVVTNDTIALTAAGTAIITVDSIRVSSSDACGVATEILSDTLFSCADTGLNNITLTVTDVNGNASVLSATVYVIDTIPPTLLVQNDTLYLSSAGQTYLDTSFFDLGSFDNCAIASYVLSQDTFDCSDVGSTVTIGLTVTDVSGNVSLDTIDITILDTVAPTLFTQNITVQLDSFGNASIDTTMINSGSFDACGIDTMYLDVVNFTCAEVGTNTVTLTAVDVNGNIDSATATVTVEDNIAPDVVITNDTIALDASGTMVSNLDSIRVSATDACGIQSEVLTDTLFDCTDIGLNNVTLTVTDVNGNVTVLSATVYVIDTIAPTVLVADDTLYLDASGVATLDTSLFDLGSFDNCGIASYVLSETSFDCDSAGQTLTIDLTVTDVNANVTNTTVQITVLDTVRPVMAVQNITVQLDSNGNATIDSSMIDNGTSDACGIATLVLSDTSFSCIDVGVNTVTLVATDVNGNQDSATATVTVEDNIAPSAFAFAAIDVYLDQNGADTIEVIDIDSASFDACGIETYALSDTTFDCSDIGTPVTVTLTLTDSNGNVSTAQTLVTVLDTLVPIMVTQNVTIYLNDSGQASITVPTIDNGTSDNCTIDSIYLSQYDFDCSHTVSPVDVMLYAIDQSGNIDSAGAVVTVIDSIRPVIACPNDTTLFNDPDACGAVFTYSTPVAYDYCGIDTVTQTDGSGYFSGDEFPVGTTVVQFTAVDVNGNLDSCSFTVTVVDTQPPVVVCPPDTSICDSTFTFSDPVISDNCSGSSLVQISGVPSGQFYPVGVTTNTFVVTDPSGLTDTCSFQVTRYDYPSSAFAGDDTAVCEVDTLQLQATAPAVGNGQWTALTPGTSVEADSVANTFAQSLQYGDNVFVWTVSNGVCAVNVDTVVIRRDETPTQSVLPGMVTYCEEEAVTVTANEPSVGTGHWNVISGGAIYDTLANPATLEEMIVGDIDIQWIISNGVCPDSRDTQRIVNFLDPTVDIGEDYVAFSGFNRQMAPIVTNAATYEWRPGSIFSDSTIADPVATVNQTATIILTVTSDSGCTASDTVIYVVNDLSDIPTGITPNGDNINDVWNIGGIENYPDARVLIYDQAGRKIFESVGYEQPWDGTFNGTPLPRASYYWIIDLQDGVNPPLKGIISVIR